MPRKSSGGRSAPRHRPAASSPLRNPPRPAVYAPLEPMQDTNRSVRGRGFFAAVKDVGLSFGIGNAVAHRAVDAAMGRRVLHYETVASSAPATAPAPNSSSRGGADACGGQIKAMQDCLNNYVSDISKCQFFMDMPQECRRSFVIGSGA